MSDSDSLSEGIEEKWSSVPGSALKLPKGIRRGLMNCLSDTVCSIQRELLQLKSRHYRLNDGFFLRMKENEGNDIKYYENEKEIDKHADWAVHVLVDDGHATSAVEETF